MCVGRHQGVHYGHSNFRHFGHRAWLYEYEVLRVKFGIRGHWGNERVMMLIILPFGRQLSG